MRRDSLGFFWNDTPVVKEKKTSGPRVAVDRGPRPLPPFPETGWTAPKEFPNLDGVKHLGFDTETKDLDLEEKGPGCRRGAHMIGVSVATADRAWYFPMRHELGANLDPVNVQRWMKDQLTRPGVKKYGTNLLYDLDFASTTEGVDVAGPYHDIQVAESLIDENADGYSLDAISNRHLGRGKEDSVLKDWIKDAYGAESDYRAHLWHAPADLVGFYAEFDAALPMQVARQQADKLDADGLLDLNNTEQALIPMLLKMRQRGIRVDIPHTERLEAQLETEVEEMFKDLRSMASMEVNINAADSIAKAFDKLGIGYPRTPKTNKPSFTKEWLLAHPSPIAKLISNIRSKQKFLDTFIRSYILDLHVDGRIHCLFNQSRTDEYGTVSGRFSSALPNLQNIPIRDDEWGPLLRAIFLPDEDEFIGSLDWSQIEFRILTHYGKGPSAEQARQLYREDPNADFHRMVAELTGLHRKYAKSINFGLVYGMGIELLAENAGLTMEEAPKVFDEYHTRLPFVKAIYDDTSNAATTRGYIKTLLGRRRRFHLWEPRYYKRKFKGDRPKAYPLEQAIAEYGPSNLKRAYTHKALNALVQGSAADIMKQAMRQYWEQGPVDVLGAPLLTVHDELVFSVPKGDRGQKALEEVKHIMENTVQLRIPITASMGVGSNWATAH